MNTTAGYTPLESLLLFQSLLSYGIEAAAFLQISSVLKDNRLIKESSHYDAGRLSPESLQELFLQLLREELKAETTDNTEGPDHPGQSPNSRKRKLPSPPLPTLQDARQHVEKLPLLVDRLYARYRDHVVREIREDEERYESLQGEIRDLESQRSEARDLRVGSGGQNGTSATTPAEASGEVKLPNGRPHPTPPPVPRLQQQPQQVSQQQPQPSQQPQRQPQPQLQPRPQPQPQPQPQISPQISSQLPQPPQIPPQLQPSPQPTQPHLQPRPQPVGRQEEVRSGAVPTHPQPLQPLQETPRVSPPSAPVIPPPGVALQIPATATRPVVSPAVGPQVPPRSQNGSPQVLQPPQGVGFPTLRQGPPPQQPVQGEGLQRPEGVGRGKPPPIPPPHPNQPQVPGQLKWEPLYQPNQNAPPHRQPQTPGAFQPQPQRPFQGPQLPPGQQQPPAQLPPQWNQQAQAQTQTQSPYGSPRPLQAQLGAQQGQTMQQPGLLPPQTAAQFSPPLQQTPIRPPSETGLVPSTQGRSPAPGPVVNQGRPSQPPYPPQSQSPYPGYQVQPQGRPLAAASPTPPLGPPQGPTIPPQRVQTPQAIPHGQAPVSQPFGPPASASPAVTSGEPHRGYGAPYNLPPRSALPDHVLQQQTPRLATTPHPPSRISPISSAPQTPVHFRPFQAVGSGTKWKLATTPSTPRPGIAADMPSPAYEPLSPVLPPAALPPPIRTSAAAPAASVPTASAMQTAAVPLAPPTPVVQPSAAAARSAASMSGTPSPESRRSEAKSIQEFETPAKRRGRQPRSAQRPDDASSLTPRPAAPQVPASSIEEASHSTNGLGSAVIKHEETTPQPQMETGDTTADESVTGRRRPSRIMKRKRQDTSPTPMESREPPAPPTHVLWTRSFNKVSHSAMEQIMGHRDASLFAHQIRERDAPGYRGIVLQPQDLKSIRAAINHGNRTAAAAAASLPGGDPGTSSVWLPISEELVPPRGIINSAQLDRELAHMFSNAIMYNPDPNRGPGPSFMRSDEEVDAEDGEDDTVLGYKVDENRIVNDARAMFVEVQKLLSDMRNAEIQRGAPPPPMGNGASQARMSETPAAGRDERASTAAEDEAEETENAGTASKRRRITRG